MSKEEGKKDSSEGEDIPSDFFDDFCKDDFMEVIDSWKNEDQESHGRIDEDAVNSVSDLRELIPKDEREDRSKRRGSSRRVEREDLDEYTRPGSRRDPSKTMKAIKEDKEVKVKELLAKHLESIDDLRPPGTELDDYFDESRNSEKKKIIEELARKQILEKEENVKERYSSPRHTEESSKKYQKERSRHGSRDKRHPQSPTRSRRESPGPYRRPFRRESPRRFRRESPLKRRPDFHFRRGHYSYGSGGLSFNARRPPHSSHWSPRRSPRKYRASPDSKRPRRSRSPYKRYKSRSRSFSPKRNDFLYPDRYQQSTVSQDTPPFVPPVNNEYSTTYPYPQTTYASYAEQGFYPPQPDSAPLQNIPMPAPHLPQPVPAPTMVPAPSMTSPIVSNPEPIASNTLVAPEDALAKLVAEGKLSHEDYLKLAPNRGANPNVDPKERINVLNRCLVVIKRLSNLQVPARLHISNHMGQDQKAIAPKFCSPLKRQSAVEFYFSKTSKPAVLQRNKEIIDRVISCLSLDEVVSRSKKKSQKDMKDASVQTTLPVCEVCEIRESTQFCDVSTTIDPEHFSSTVHTQVIEEDLYSSKSVFNPSGSGATNAPISIAHLTPAQLVSQLAARAKTLKQTDGPQHMGSRPNYDYDYHRGGNQFHNSNYNNNYRY